MRPQQAVGGWKWRVGCWWPFLVLDVLVVAGSPFHHDRLKKENSLHLSLNMHHV